VRLGIVPFGIITGVEVPPFLWRWRMTFATIIAGLAALHVFAWLT
jgi:hypothetical protein